MMYMELSVIFDNGYLGLITMYSGEDEFILLTVGKTLTDFVDEYMLHNNV